MSCNCGYNQNLLKNKKNKQTLPCQISCVHAEEVCVVFDASCIGYDRVQYKIRSNMLSRFTLYPENGMEWDITDK